LNSQLADAQKNENKRRRTQGNKKEREETGKNVWERNLQMIQILNDKSNLEIKEQKVQPYAPVPAQPHTLKNKAQTIN
jgi:hypothetical protein